MTQNKNISDSTSSNLISTKKASSSDADKIAAILHASYNIKSLDEAKTAFLEEIKTGKVYIIALEKSTNNNGADNNQNADVVLGIVSYALHGLSHHGLAELDRIAVLPDARGKGIGTILFNALISELKKYYTSKGSSLRKLYILTHEDNTKARSFYEKLSLKLETTLKSHYYENRNECVYSMFFRNKKNT